jgi:hypothetical protein
VHQAVPPCACWDDSFGPAGCASEVQSFEEMWGLELSPGSRPDAAAETAWKTQACESNGQRRLSRARAVSWVVVTVKKMDAREHRGMYFGTLSLVALVLLDECSDTVHTVAVVARRGRS